MGTAVYDCREFNRENIHVYCRSRKDSTCGVVYLIINSSLTDTISVALPKEALRYTLHAQTMRSSTMLLNGKDLTISGTCGIPEFIPELQPQGTISLAPGSCTFLVL